jgi:hypothetical protein
LCLFSPLFIWNKKERRAPCFINKHRRWCGGIFGSLILHFLTKITPNKLFRMSSRDGCKD